MLAIYWQSGFSLMKGLLLFLQVVKMASFFGEVLPILSRAVEDDDEEFEIPVENVDLIVNKSNVSFTNLSNLVVAIGSSASSFARAYCLGQGLNKNQGKVTNSTIEPILTFMKAAKSYDDTFMSGLDYTKEKKEVAQIFAHPKRDDTLVFSCDYVREDLATGIIQKLFEHLSLTDKTKVTILSSEKSVNYKRTGHNSELEFPLVRYLLNNTLDDTLKPTLEPPNFISGIEAAALTECVIREIPGVAIVCFESEASSDSVECFFNSFKASEHLKPLLLHDSLQNISIVPEGRDSGYLYL